MKGEDNFFLRGSSLNDICPYLKGKKAWINCRKVLDSLCSCSCSCIVPFDLESFTGQKIGLSQFCNLPLKIIPIRTDNYKIFCFWEKANLLLKDLDSIIVLGLNQNVLASQLMKFLCYRIHLSEYVEPDTSSTDQISLEGERKRRRQSFKIGFRYFWYQI